MAPDPVTTVALRSALVLLAVASGAADAFAFLLLGGIFTANMTGNLVLVGMFTRPGWPVTLAGASTAVAFFAGAAYAAFRSSPKGVPGARYPRGAVIALTVPGLVLQLALSVSWLLVGGRVELVGSCALVALSSAVLGIQTVLAKRLSGSAGLTTTFVTGTLTTIMEDLAERRTGARALQSAVVVAVVVGAVTGTALAAAAPVAAPFLPLGLSASATAVLLAGHRAGAERPRTRLSTRS